jgi:hypothetical protein
MERVFDLLSRVEHVRLADDIMRPGAYDMTEKLARLRPQSNQKQQQQQQQSQLNGKSAMIKMDGKWSGDKTRNLDLLGNTRLIINCATSNSASGSDTSKNGAKTHKELPSIFLLNQNQYDDGADDHLLNSVKKAADENLVNHAKHNAANNMSSPTAPPPPPQTTVNNTNNNNNVNTNHHVKPAKLSEAELESIIMQKLFIHEKKSVSLETNNNNNNNNSDKNNNKNPVNNNDDNNNIHNHIHNNNNNNKRDYQSVVLSTTTITTSPNEVVNSNDSSLDNSIESTIKKRKLNNGGEFNYFINFEMKICIQFLLLISRNIS